MIKSGIPTCIIGRLVSDGNGKWSRKITFIHYEDAVRSGVPLINFLEKQQGYIVVDRMKEHE